MTTQNPQDKINFLLQVKQSISIELYRYCLLAGFDPETFNYKDYSEKNLIGIQFNENNLFLKSHCEKMVAIEKKIEQLNSEE
jgi:hypothetical protein